jgi:hypothetical protein
MKIVKSLTMVGTVFAFTACANSPAPPLAGNIHGMSFNITGARTSNIDSNLVITLVNVSASCESPESPTDGQVSVDITIPRAALAPGTYQLGNGITVGVTKIAKPNGGPATFDAVVLSSATIVVQSVGTTIQGSLSGSANGVSVDGTFTAPMCQ